MVHVIKSENRQGRLAEQLGLDASKDIGDNLNTFFANRSLNSVIQDKALENAPQSKKLEALRSALSPYGEKGQQILQQRMAIEQQEMNEKQQEVLGRFTEGQKVSAKDLSKLSPENQLKVMQIQKNRQIGRSVYDSLIKSGYPEETARIWQGQMENAPTGGQTDVIRQVNDLIRRSKAGKGLSDQGSSSEEDQELNDIISTQDEGLTPSERVKRESERFKIGQPIRQEAGSKLRSFARNKERLGILESLNTSGKLPKNFGLLNVDKEGNLRLPFAASPESQRFVKTLNEFSVTSRQ